MACQDHLSEAEALLSDIVVPGLSAALSIALEALFEQDLPGAPPASISKQVGDALVAKGYAEPTTFQVGRGAMAVTVKTYRITVAGHMAYCAACPEPPEDI